MENAPGQLGVHCLQAVWAHLTTYLGLWLLTSTNLGRPIHSVLRFVGYSAGDTGHGPPQHDWPDHIGIMRLSDRSRVAVELVEDRLNVLYLFRNLFYHLGDERQHALI